MKVRWNGSGKKKKEIPAYLYKRSASALEKRMFGDCEEIEELRYNIDELEQIAEHLLIYCKHNKGCEE